MTCKRYLLRRFSPCRRLFFVALLLTSIGLALPLTAQDSKPLEKGKGIIFKMPENVRPAEFPEKEFKGVMMLMPKRPAGMFVFYAKDSDTMTDLMLKLRPLFGGMFIHEEKTKLSWTESPLSAHEKMDETGLLSLTENKDMEVQIAAYLRQVRGHNVTYGYFAMRHKKPKKDDGEFMDTGGKGVKAFDALVKTLQ